MRPDEARGEFEIDSEPIWPDEDGRLEPIFLEGPLWIEFTEAEPFVEEPRPDAADPRLIEFAEFDLRDPEPDDEGEYGPPPALPSARAPRLGVAGSVGVHLLALLTLVAWTSMPAEIAGAIPVQLVLQEAHGTPREMAAGEAVAETADVAASDAVANAAPPPPEPPKPAAPPAAKAASAASPPKPLPPPPAPAAKPSSATVAAAPPKPAPTAAAPPDPVVSAPPPSAAAVRSAPAPSQPAPARAPVQLASAPASGSGRGDYLNRLVALTRSHLDMLPPSLLGGRRGQATLSVVVMEDGTIGRIAVKHSSGYPDIDAKIEQMVAAVGHFPPVPNGFQKPAVELDFNMSFPDALQQ